MPTFTFFPKDLANVLDPQVMEETGYIRLKPLDPTIYTINLGEGDGSEINFSGVLGQYSNAVLYSVGEIRPFSVTINNGTFSVTDNGDGHFFDSNLLSPSTIDYETGEIDLTFLTPPTGNIYVSFKTYKHAVPFFPYEYITGDIVFTNWNPEALSELFGFVGEEVNQPSIINVGDTSATPGLMVFELDIEGQIVYKTSIGYQISVDDGISWLFYSSGSWQPGDGTDSTFASWQDTDLGISTLPLATTTKQIKVKARLFPSDDGQLSPVLKEVNVYHELVYDLEVDLKRSLKQFLDNNLRVTETYQANVSSKTQVTVNTSPNEEDATYSVTYYPDKLVAYNLTNDPAKTINIASSLVGNAVKFSSSQTGRVEVKVRANIPIYIEDADERFFTSVSRGVIITIDSWEERPEFATLPTDTISPVFEPVFSENKFRRRQDPGNFIQFHTSIMCQAPLQSQATAITAAIRKLFNRYLKIQSLATGNTFSVVNIPAQSSYDEIKDGVYAKTLFLEITAWAQEGDYYEVPMVTQINTFLGPKEIIKVNSNE